MLSGSIYTAPVSDHGLRHPVYIHSKVLIVDDRFLTVGSANFTNRSQRIDTELNLSWEACPGDAALVRSIRRIRIALLTEHASVRGLGHIRSLYRGSGLVQYLDSLTGRNPVRLCRHPISTGREDNPLIKLIPTIAIDPEEQVFVETLYRAGRRLSGILARGMALFAAWFQKRKA
jgi:hypothetical protein